MVETIVSSDTNRLILTIPDEMIGRQIKVIAYTDEEEAEVIGSLNEKLYADEATIFIPQWQKDLVLAEKKRVEDDPTLLTDWNTVKAELKAHRK